MAVEHEHLGQWEAALQVRAAPTPASPRVCDRECGAQDEVCLTRRPAGTVALRSPVGPRGRLEGGTLSLSLTVSLIRLEGGMRRQVRPAQPRGSGARACGLKSAYAAAILRSGARGARAAR